MSVYIFNEDVKSTLLDSIDETSTTINIKTASGIYNNPQALVAGEIATLKIVDRINNPMRREVVTYTGRSVISGGFSLTGVSRAQEGTTAQLWETGCTVIEILNSNVATTLGILSDDVAYIQAHHTEIVVTGDYNDDVVYVSGTQKLPDFVLDLNGDVVYAEV